MTVLIYVDTSKQVGDRDHLKVFANARQPRRRGLRKTIPEGVAFEYEVRSSLVTTREAHVRFQQDVEHILDDLKRSP